MRTTYAYDFLQPGDLAGRCAWKGPASGEIYTTATAYDDPATP